MSCIHRCLLYVNYYSAGCRRQNKTVWLSISTAIVTLYFLLSSPTEFGNNFFQTRDAAAAPTMSNSNSNNNKHPPILYGHVHVAKTGGTSLNGILANKFDHVCGHKGFSYDAYQDNERAKQEGVVTLGLGWSRSRVDPKIMDTIGYENCDYISVEQPADYLMDHFANEKFHSMKMELHIPCRDRLEHLMSMCNYQEQEVCRQTTCLTSRGRVRKGDLLFQKTKIACHAKTDEELFASVEKCFLHLQRYNHALMEGFDVKCFDFKNQFTTYIDYMSGILSHRRFVSEPYIHRETNDPRNKEEECIWYNPVVKEKVDKFLLENVQYYQFCDQCMGSENEIAK